MSWSFLKAGTVKDVLKASVQQESAPQAVRDEICKRIDQEFLNAGWGNRMEIGRAILVESYGHFDTSADRPYNGFDDMRIRVRTIPLINTPLDDGK